MKKSLLLFTSLFLLAGCGRVSLAGIESDPCELFDIEDMQLLFEFEKDSVSVEGKDVFPYHRCTYTTTEGPILVNYFVSEEDAVEEFEDFPSRYAIEIEHLGDEALRYKETNEMMVLYRENLFIVNMRGVDGGVNAAKSLAAEIVDTLR